jgi:serine/threonine protein phosphatase PrpC
MIKSQWLGALFPHKTSYADTTCLFCIVSSTSILLCQLGDGIIIYSENDVIKVLETKSKDFSNETMSLSRARINDWSIISIPKKKGCTYKLFISTDGVSDDIIESKLKDFFLEITNQIVKAKERQNPIIKRLLKKWPNNFSLDDKTIVVVK